MDFIDVDDAVLEYVLLPSACLIVFFAVFGLLEKYWPRDRSLGWVGPHWKVDLKHYFISSPVVQLATAFTVGIVVSLSSPLANIPLLSVVLDGREWIGALPFWVQMLLIIALSDFVYYWMHRWAHEVDFLWAFHSVHHGVRELNWLSGLRVHPFDVVLRQVAIVTSILATGLSENLFYIYWSANAIASFLLHSNISIRIPFLRRLISTPEFHHWHHALDPIDKNYSNRFPIFDQLFGSLHLPDKQYTENFGCHEHVPLSYIGQLMHPFRNRRTREVGDV